MHALDRDAWIAPPTGGMQDQHLIHLLYVHHHHPWLSCCCPTHLPQVSTSFFSIRPVLACLQAMDGVPFAEELLHLEAPKPLTYLPADKLHKVCAWAGASWWGWGISTRSEDVMWAMVRWILHAGLLDQSLPRPEGVCLGAKVGNVCVLRYPGWRNQ